MHSCGFLSFDYSDGVASFRAFSDIYHSTQVAKIVDDKLLEKGI